MGDNDDEVPLPMLYRRAKAVHSKLDQLNPSEPGVETTLKEAVKQLMQCMQMVDKLGLFSRNETKEDVATGDLKYLMLPFLLAEVLQRMPGEDRRPPLGMARRNLQVYLERCGEMELLGQEALAAFRRGDEPLDPQTKRAEKVARFKREKAIQQGLEALARRGGEGGEGGRQVEAGEEERGMDEDDERELWTLEIERAALQAQDQMGHIKEELQLLDHRFSLTPAQLAAVPMQQQTPELAALKDSIMSAAANLQGDRERFHQGVFRPSHALPTMSIEEFGEIEHREMMQRQEEGAAAQQAMLRAKAERGGNSSDEDENELRKQREWDDFRDANPRGHGNRKNMG